MCLGQSGGLRCVCILKAVLYKACTRLIKVPLEFRSLYCFAARVYRTHISRYQLTAHVHTCVLTYGGTVYHVINERLLSPRDRPDGCRCRAASLGVSTQPTPPYTFGQLLCPVILYFIALLIAVLSGHSCATTPCRDADLSALSRLRVQHEITRSSGHHTPCHTHAVTRLAGVGPESGPPSHASRVVAVDATAVGVELVRPRVPSSHLPRLAHCPRVLARVARQLALRRGP